MKSLKDFCEPCTHLSWWTDWFLIILGCVFVAAGYVFFINPYGLVPGGVYGLAIVIHHLMPSLQVGTISYVFDIPLLILSFVLLGSKMGTRTIVAAMITPLIMNGISWLVYPSEEALDALDSAQILNGNLDMSDHLILTTIIGSAVVGLGAGIIIRQRATSGGTDVVGMLMQKFMHIRYSRSILIVDGAVVLCGLLVIGLGIGTEAAKGGCLLSLYSLLAIYLMTRVITIVINGFKNEQIIFVISAHRMDRLHEYIINELDRTATSIKSSGLYTGEDKEMLFLVVKQREVPRVKEVIKEADPTAFVVITDSYDTFGEGFRNLPNPGEITPE